jgi:hypothetical protein
MSKIYIPTCPYCDTRYYAGKKKNKVYCVECDCALCYNCAIYDEDDSNEYMICYDCFLQKDIENDLVEKGILNQPLGKLEGNLKQPLLDVYVDGKKLSFDIEKDKMIIDEEYDYEKYKNNPCFIHYQMGLYWCDLCKPVELDAHRYGCSMCGDDFYGCELINGWCEDCIRKEL